jgi:hypothetical protein
VAFVKEIRSLIAVISMNKKIVSMAMFALLTIVMLAPFIPSVQATNDPADDGMFHNVTGHWIVDSDKNYRNFTTIHMADGNVTVKSGFTLTLDQTTLEFGPTSDGSRASSSKAERP